MHLSRKHLTTVARWTLIALLSVGASWMLVQQNEPSQGNFSQKMALQQAKAQQHTVLGQQKVNRMVMAGLDQAHLLTGNNKLESIETVREQLDPLESNGAFYHFRKMLEQLAGIAILPMILIGVVMALFQQKTLVKIGIKFFTILFLLWAYPYWDVLMFQAIGKPMAEQLMSAEHMNRVASNINNGPPPDEVAGAGTTPFDGISRFAGDAAMCMSLIAEDTPQSELPDVCSDPIVQAQMGGLANRAATSEEDQNRLAEFLSSVPGGAGWEFSTWLFERVSEAGAMLENIGSWMTETIFGILLVLIEMIWTAFLWFLLLGLEFARALSLTFAPIAIVWGLWPGKGQGLSTGSAAGWFKGHAFISFLAPGIALIALLFWGFAVTVFTLDVEFSSLGAFASSVAVKFALFAVLLYFMFNMGKFIRMLSGDVTSVAMEIGDKVRMSAINTAKAPVKGGAMAVGGALGGAKGAQIGGKIADGASKPFDMMNNATNSLSQRFQSQAGEGAVEGDKGGFGIAQKARDRASQEAFTTFLAGKGDLPAGELGGEMAARATRGAFSDTLEEAHQFEDEVAERRRELNAPSQPQRQRLAEGLSEMQRTREEQQQYREQHDIPEPHLREGEVLDIDPRDIAEGLRRAHVSEMGVGLGEMGAQKMILEDGTNIEIQAERLDSGEVNFSLNDEAAEGAHSLLADNVDLREAVFEEGARAFGKRENVPTVIQDGVEVPNMQQMLNQSDDVAHAFRELAGVSMQAQSELHEREKISHKAQEAGIEEGSAMEQALRMMDNEVILKAQERMSDQDYRRFLESQGARTLRLAETAEQQDGQVSSDQIEHIFSPEETRALTSRLKETELTAAGSADSVNEQSLRQAVRAQKQHLQQMKQRELSHQGQRLGLNYSAYIKNGTQQFKGQAGSLFEEQLQDKVDNLKQQNPDLSTEEAEAKIDQQALYQQVRKAVRESADNPDQLHEQEINERIFLASADS